MKNFILVITLFLFTVFNTSAQATVNGQPINSIDVEYVRIVGTSNLLNTKVTIDLEFGQQNKLFSTKDTKILNSDGSPLVLNSMVDALNFMSENGYEFISAYAITTGNQNVYHYLKKRKNK